MDEDLAKQQPEASSSQNGETPGRHLAHEELLQFWIDG
jgi:hypothetical protein